jgi:hypothetical protein
MRLRSQQVKKHISLTYRFKKIDQRLRAKFGNRTNLLELIKKELGYNVKEIEKIKS